MSVTLFAGPPCSGKTSLIKQVINGIIEPPVPIDAAACCLYNANHIRQQAGDMELSGQDVLYHYDCMRPFKRQLPFSTDNDPFLNHLKTTAGNDKLVIITILSPLADLHQRMTERINRLGQLDIDESRSVKMQRLLSLYTDQHRYAEQMQAWIGFCAQLEGHLHHLCFNPNGQQPWFSPPLPTAELRHQLVEYHAR